MRPSALYPFASGLLLLFAVGHSLGFQQSDPAWGTGAVLGSMQSSQFSVQGFTRSIGTSSLEPACLAAAAWSSGSPAASRQDETSHSAGAA